MDKRRGFTPILLRRCHATNKLKSPSTPPDRPLALPPLRLLGVFRPWRAVQPRSPSSSGSPPASSEVMEWLMSFVSSEVHIAATFGRR